MSGSRTWRRTIRYNRTNGRAREIVNPALRTVSFSPDGTLVTFWTKRPADAQRSVIGVWAVAALGGEPQPYLEGAAEFDWSADASQLVYHTTAAGDPTFIRAAAQAATRSAPVQSAGGDARTFSGMVSRSRIHLFRPG